jgi:hypothetical protein
MEYRQIWVNLWIEWLMKRYRNTYCSVNQKEVWNEEDLGKD